MKYRNFQRRFTYSVERREACLASGVKPLRAAIRVGDTVRWGVWLGRHVC